LRLSFGSPFLGGVRTLGSMKRLMVTSWADPSSAL
jgi:hypothetical protein